MLTGGPPPDPVSIRRAMPVVVTTDPAATREGYERFLGFEVVMDEQGS